MIYVRSLEQEEELELRRMTRHEIGRVSQRAQMVLLSAQRRTVPEIATIFTVSRATVRYWINQFDARGPAGLYDEPRGGRPRKAAGDGQANIVKMLAQAPQSVVSYLAPFCTTTLLAFQ